MKSFNEYMTEAKKNVTEEASSELIRKFAQSKKESISLIELLERKIYKFTENEKNVAWDALGSLQHVVELLKEVDRFLGKV